MSSDPQDQPENGPVASLEKRGGEPERQRQRRRGIYLLPNLFTTGALFSGFYAIIAGMNGHFEAAAIAIFVAGVFDGLDGRVARLTHTQSDFGAEYDSLSDMVAFGVAPALVAFSWSLSMLGKLGWMAAFIYCAGAALRLARFNAQIAVADSRYFTGLPSPSGAALVAGMIWVGADLGISGDQTGVAIFAAFWVALSGALMVSNFRYSSFKQVDPKGHVPFYALLAIVVGVAVVNLHPPLVLLCLVFAYALSGPVMSLRGGKDGEEEPPASGAV